LRREVAAGYPQHYCTFAELTAQWHRRRERVRRPASPQERTAPMTDRQDKTVGLGQRVPQEWAKNVRVPAFLYQVRGDILTHPSDVQAMYDNIAAADKKLQWIKGTTARWDGYLEFQCRPQPMLDWFAQYMS
jgi:esterase/lipase